LLNYEMKLYIAISFSASKTTPYHALKIEARNLH
jgi:hypothetical protein